MAIIPRTAGSKASQPNNFDSLRLIFAILVILSHSFPLTQTTNANEPLSRLTYGQITFGNISVWAFFVISGFLITQSWTRSPNVAKYLKRRVGRIFPGFIVAALATLLLVVPIASSPGALRSISVPQFIFSTLRLQLFDFPPVFAQNPAPNVLNGSLWSVPYEFWCYLGVMSLGLIGLLRRRWVVVVLFFMVIGLHLYMDFSGWNPSGAWLGQIFGYPPFWATVLPFYLAGTIFYLYGGQKLLRTPMFFAAAALLIGSIFVPHGLDVTTPTCGAYLLMGLAWWRPLHPLNLGRFGDFSYGTYLYAFPIQQLVIMAARGHISPWLLFLTATPLTVIVGALSWFLVERRFLPRSSQLKHEGILPTPQEPSTDSSSSSRSKPADTKELYDPLLAIAPSANAHAEFAGDAPMRMRK
jgi:peptidoglycan/LPS O-acetylase OafA/YrhL